MSVDKIYIIGAVVALLLILIFFLIRVRIVMDGLTAMVNDTLKKEDKKGVLRWSRTSLTMATAWGSVLYSFFFDLYKNGFNEMAFYALCGIALGAKVTDAYSKKLDPTITGPNETDGNTK